MSVGERVTDLVTKPIVGTAKGAVTGGATGAIGVGLLGGATGALGGGLLALGTLAVPAAIATGILAALFFSHAILAMLVVGAAVTAAGAVAGAIGLGLPAALGGGAIGAVGGGIIGNIVGTFKGIKAFFSGRDHSAENEQQLRAMREQALMEQTQTAAYMRQQQRAAAMSGIDNPNASDNNVSKLQAQQQAPGVNIPTP